MKILFILESFYPNIGGVETLFKHLADHLSHQNHQITVLTNKNKDQASSEVLPSGVKVKRITTFNRYIFTFLGWLPALREARKHDLIHTTSYNAGIPAYIAGLFTRKKVIITFHEAWGKLWFDLPFFSKISLFFHYLFEQMLLKLPFHLFIAVSHYTAEQLAVNGIRKEKIKVIYNGLDYSIVENKKKIDHHGSRENPNSTYHFLYFGRLGISKGLDILIKGASQVKEDFKLTLILPKEPSGLLNAVKELIVEHEIDDKVTIKHHLPYTELQDEVINSDTVIVPSYSEGFGFTATETIAMNTPIISSNRGSLAEVVSGKHINMTSFDPDGLASAMQRAMNDDFDFTEVKTFKLSDSVQEYVNLYQDLSLKHEK